MGAAKAQIDKGQQGEHGHNHPGLFPEAQIGILQNAGGGKDAQADGQADRDPRQHVAPPAQESLLPTVLIMLENRFQRLPVRRNAQ